MIEPCRDGDHGIYSGVEMVETEQKVETESKPPVPETVPDMKEEDVVRLRDKTRARRK